MGAADTTGSGTPGQQGVHPIVLQTSSGESSRLHWCSSAFICGSSLQLALSCYADAERVRRGPCGFSTLSAHADADRSGAGGVYDPVAAAAGDGGGVRGAAGAGAGRADADAAELLCGRPGDGVLRAGEQRGAAGARGGDGGLHAAGDGGVGRDCHRSRSGAGRGPRPRPRAGDERDLLQQRELRAAAAGAGVSGGGGGR